MSAIRATLSSGAPVFGAFNGSSDPVMAERQGAAGWDFVIIDLQHGVQTDACLVTSIMGVELGGSVALVRVAWNEPSAIMRALDSGAAGVVVPMVSTAEEAAAAARSCRYPPLGVRSYGQFRGKRYGGTDGANEAVLCLVMIETAEGLENLDAILDTPGVDGVFVGPNDLKLGMGLKVATPTTDERFVAAFDKIRDTCIRTGRIAGSFFLSAADIEPALSAGWRLIVTTPDIEASSLRAIPFS